MGFRRFAAWLIGLAAILIAAGAYRPDLVKTWAPNLAPQAEALHALLPAALAGTPVAGAPQPAAQPPAGGGPPVPVVVGQVLRKDFPWRIDAIGTVQPIASVALRTHLDATIDKVLVADGAAVKRGDVLIKLDSRQVEAQLKGAEAQLAKDQAQLEQNKRDVVRDADLVARAATPTINLDNAKTTQATTEAAILGDKAAIDNFKVQLDWLTIAAPITGRVGVINLKEGNLAKAGDNSAAGVLATINQISPIYAAFSITQTMLPSLREAMAAGAKVTATPQGSLKTATGRLALIENAIDPGTGTILARAIFDNADEMMWPGQLCNLSITLRDEPDTVVAPREAVQVGQSGNFVFTIVDGRAHVQPVVAGRNQDGMIVVTKGLAGGETVVIDGALLLREGTTVSIREAQKGAS
ncbi:MAG TPA: efflux RND transporter periplasmic adaptor subunit [Roseiarcus sp.]|nr:efflux RND transporter periplasmic adaptor subunit [Roseiarcus sp.]